MNFSKIKFKNYLVVLALISAFIGCKKQGCTDPVAINYDFSAEKDDNSCIYEEFDKRSLLENITNNYINPAIDNYKAEITSLDSLVVIFSQQPTEQGLIAIRNSWKNSLLSWQDISFIDFGPSEYILLKKQTNIYPVDTLLVKENIAIGSWNLENSQNYDSKGLQAIDYLINKRGYSNLDLINYFDSSAHAKKYIKAITEDLLINITYVDDQWVSYSDNFINDFETNSQGSSVSTVVNALCLHYEFYVRRGKIGLPLGVFNGFSQQAMPELVECYHYGESLPFAIRSVQSLKKFINGNNFAGQDEGLGFDDYMDFVNAQQNSNQLSDVINNQMDQIIIELNNLNDPFSNEVIQNKPAVSNAYGYMQELVPLIKVDMTSALGVLITYQDNDGD